MIDFNKTVFCFALEEEARDRFQEFNCLFTGMGKVNAAFSLTKYLAANPQINTVINLGTCGAKNLQAGTLVYATSFYQRDWLVPKFAFANEEFEKIEYGLEVKNLPKVACGTGDSFVSEWSSDFEFEIVDMEAFALAVVCKNLGKDFICIKSVSDNANEENGVSAIEQWHNYLEKAAKNLKEFITLMNKG